MRPPKPKAVKSEVPPVRVPECVPGIDGLGQITPGGLPPEQPALVPGDAGYGKSLPGMAADEPYRVLVQNMAEGALTARPDGLILFSNQQFASMLGLPLGRVIGSSLHDLIAAEDAPLLIALLTGRMKARAEVRLKRGPAALVPALLSASTVFLETTECVCIVITNLGETKGAEAELGRSRKMFQLVLDTMPLGVFWKNRDGRYLGCNHRFLTDSGFSAQDDITGRADSEMPWKGQAERFLDEDRQVMDAGLAKIGCEKPVVGTDGVRRWLRTNKVPLTGSTGGVIGVLGTHEDITESKQDQEALRESQKGFRSVVENAPEAIFVATGGCFRYLNPPAVRLLGAASASELLGRPLTESVHPDSHAALAEAIRQVQECRGTTIPVAQKYLRRDGAVLDIEGSVVPFIYEGEQGGLVLVRDVTERKRAEEAMLAKERLLSESQRIAHLGSWDWTVQDGTSVLAWTAETYRLFGVSPDTFVLSPESFVSLIHPDDRAALQAWTSACLAGLEPPDLEFRVPLQDGSLRIINGRGRVVAQDGANRSVRMVGIAEDITERKRAEETLRRYSAELVETNEELHRFTRIVVHDLRAPFVNLKGFCSELRHSIDTVRQPEAALLANLAAPERAAVAEALQETIPEALGFIESSVTRMEHLTSALLRLSRAGQRELHMEELDAEELLQRTLLALRHQIGTSLVAVKTGPLPRITSDGAAIEQVFWNLLDNAIKYLDPQRPGQIEVSAEETLDAVVFHVRDNGRGIAEDDMDKVFVPFRRLGPQDVPGEGVGLAFVRALLRRLGGRIECHSQLGVGTTFSVILPKAS